MFEIYAFDFPENVYEYRRSNCPWLVSVDPSFSLALLEKPYSVLILKENRFTLSLYCVTS